MKILIIDAKSNDVCADITIRTGKKLLALDHTAKELGVIINSLEHSIQEYRFNLVRFFDNLLKFSSRCTQ